MATPKFKRAIVVGASSGIGRELTIQLAKEGTSVVAIGRRMDRLAMLAESADGRIFPLQHDVTNSDSVPLAFQEATKMLDGLDLVVYASGVMPEVGFYEYNFDKDKAMVDVNLLGAIAWINLAAERMEQTKHGSIVAIGSVAGDRGRSGNPVYNTTKAALATYMEAVRNRIARHDVKVCLVKPGPVATEMTVNLGIKNAMPVEEAAAKILKVADKNGEFYLKFAHRIAFFVIRNIPSWIFRRLKI